MTKIDTSTEAIAKLLDGMTEGPWTWEAESGDWPDNSLVDANGDTVMWFDFDLGFRFSTEANARFIAAARELVPALAAERDALRAERERLALAICGGEDAPGYANAQTVDALEVVAAKNRDMHAGTVNALLRVEAERDAMRARAEQAERREAALKAYNDEARQFLRQQDAMRAEVERLRASAEQAEARELDLVDALITIRDKRKQCNRAVDCQAVARAAITEWEAANG